MRETSLPVAGTLPAALDDLCRTFGIWKTTTGLVRAAWRHHRLVNQATGLSNRMRRDIGLPEIDEPPDDPWIAAWASPRWAPAVRVN